MLAEERFRGEISVSELAAETGSERRTKRLAGDFCEKVNRRRSEGYQCSMLK